MRFSVVNARNVNANLFDRIKGTGSSCSNVNAPIRSPVSNEKLRLLGCFDVGGSRDLNLESRARRRRTCTSLRRNQTKRGLMRKTAKLKAGDSIGERLQIPIKAAPMTPAESPS